jgi:serine/threonine protein kinase
MCAAGRLEWVWDGKDPQLHPDTDGNEVHHTLWCAPEIAEAANPQFTTASDMFALGMVMYEIAARKRPFQGLVHNDWDVVTRFQKGVILLQPFVDYSLHASAHWVLRIDTMVVIVAQLVLRV